MTISGLSTPGAGASSHGPVIPLAPLKTPSLLLLLKPTRRSIVLSKLRWELWLVPASLGSSFNANSSSRRRNLHPYCQCIRPFRVRSCDQSSWPWLSPGSAGPSRASETPLARFVGDERGAGERRILAEVRFPDVVVRVVDGQTAVGVGTTAPRRRRPEGVAPDRVVRRTDAAILVVVTRRAEHIGQTVVSQLHAGSHNRSACTLSQIGIVRAQRPESQRVSQARIHGFIAIGERQIVVGLETLCRTSSHSFVCNAPLVAFKPPQQKPSTPTGKSGPMIRLTPPATESTKTSILLKFDLQISGDQYMQTTVRNFGKDLIDLRTAAAVDRIAKRRVAVTSSRILNGYRGTIRGFIAGQSAIDRGLRQNLRRTQQSEHPAKGQPVHRLTLQR